MSITYSESAVFVIHHAMRMRHIIWSSSTCLALPYFSTWYQNDTTYLLTPWCRVLLEKLTGLQLIKKFPAFYGTRRFITALTSVRHLSLSCASPIQSTYPHPTSWRSILILSNHLRLVLPSGLQKYNKLNKSHLVEQLLNWINLCLTLTLLTWRIWWAPNNARK